MGCIFGIIFLVLQSTYKLKILYIRFEGANVEQNLLRNCNVE